MSKEDPEEQPARDPQLGFARIARRGSALVRLLHWRLGLWPTLTLAGVICIFLVCVSLWRFEELRPYLATLGAGSAAFLGPLPGLLTPEMRGKWLVAVSISTLIAAGTWFAVQDLQDRLTSARQNGALQESRIVALRHSVSTFVGGQDHDLQERIFQRSGAFYRGLYRQGQYLPIIDTSLAMLDVRNDNGHALYYAAEAYRAYHDRDNFRTMFRALIAAAAHHPESLTGDADDCYARASGYCLERLAWAHHAMAVDLFSEALGERGEPRLTALHSSLSYERNLLSMRPSGFFAVGTAQSSCQLLSGLQRELIALGQPMRNSGAMASGLAEDCDLG